MPSSTKKIKDMHKAAERASELLKSLGNGDRLLMLCHMADGEKNVSELQELLQIPQPTVSQHLSRLRGDGLVKTRRNGKAIYYTLASHEAGRIIEVLYELFCVPSSHARRPASKRKAA